MKSKLLIKFPKEVGRNPVVYDLITKYDLKINILKAAFDFNLEGHLLIDIEGTSQNISKGIEYLNGIGVHADFINSTISIEEAVCNDCGLCTSVCESRALTYNQDTLSLEFKDNKCVGCNLCIKVCPSRAIKNGVDISGFRI